MPVRSKATPEQLGALDAYHDLPDGSTAVASPTGASSTVVSRFLADGRCVWAQVFSSDRERHPAQVEQVLAKMRANPSGFCRWWLA